MATLPVSAEQIIAQFGPSLNFPPTEGYPGRDEPDEVVKTHCCFCGMQCGIKLLVKDNRIVGFEPWEEFPFNEGRLCPKGVQRYLQNNHPDRLLKPMIRSGYDVRLSSGLISAGGTPGILIPPSVMLVVMGPTIQVPVPQLFAAALVAGIQLAAYFTAYAMVRGLDAPAPVPPKAASANTPRSFPPQGSYFDSL